MLTLEQRIKESGRRSEIKREQMARIGKMKCDCANVACQMTSTGPVCKRCLDPESHASNWIRKESSGILRCGPDEFTCFGGHSMKPAHRSNY